MSASTQSSGTPNYRRVAVNEGETIFAGGGEQDSTAAAPTSSSASTSSLSSCTSRTMPERLVDKAIAAAWVLTASFVAFWTDTPHVLFSAESSAVHLLLQLVAVGVGIQTVLTLYLTVYLPYGKGLTDSSAWSVYCPRVIPVLTAVSVVTFLILVRAVWPVWGFLAPLILSVQGLGLLFALQFVPSW